MANSAENLVMLRLIVKQQQVTKHVQTSNIFEATDFETSVFRGVLVFEYLVGKGM